MQGPARAYLLGELDNFSRACSHLLPEEDDTWGRLRNRGKCGASVLLVLDELVPDRHIDLAANALGHLAPVHVPACLLHGPDDGAKAWYGLADICKRYGAGLGDQRVGARLDEKLGQCLLRLVVRDQDGREAIEGAGEEGAEELEAVGQVDGHALCPAILQVFSNHSNLLGNIINLVLGDAVLAEDGHNMCRAAGCGALIERNLAHHTSPDVAEVAILASRVHGSARRPYGKTGTQRV